MKDSGHGHRLRWSGSLGSLGIPLGSGSAARRLRSQPLDVSCLSPDAFPPLEPPAKRPKHSPLLAACASVRQLQARDRTILEPGKSLGLSKPRPAWQGAEEAALDAQLEQLTEADSLRARQLHSGDIQLLDGPAPSAGMQAACEAAAQRLGQGRLGKAMRALSAAEVRIQRATLSVLLRPLLSISHCISLTSSKGCREVEICRYVTAASIKATSCTAAGGWEDTGETGFQ